ncbi:hypothetical protein HS088_TW12G00160 [Tripterygium wilfordii]|uniref:Protein kinase domain-containing protein n=1 Tax=Tripterygium wilfordii TaxID=458696 RepID=A0A7J7CY18_TRIWF|nr:mitogen-activated protein kinase kinase kinase 17-like [Tripterygium wilfordii]KAF5738964.1 hypothetical protein HS088_TW12G00160 [Tripterygium wilfordii]
MAADDRFHCEWERGAFGSAFLAHPKSPSSLSRDSGLLLPPVFAVKSAEILFSETIENEIEVFNDLQSSGCSPYIITCFGEEFTVKDNGNTVYNLLLEYASGGSLAHVIKKLLWRWMPVEQVKRYTRQLLLGLSHIHDSGYVHCDIKPDNVLLVPSEDGDFVAKIADFGLAKRRRREFDHVKGTPRYLAPAPVVHGVLDCASDIWALGCTVYEMLTGYSVWPLDFNATTDDLYHKIASEEPHLTFRFPVETEAFLRTYLVRTPAERPTAKMLMEHPFLTGLIEEEQKEEFWEKVDENGCQQVEAENCCVKEVKVIETGCMFKDDWIFVPQKGFMLVPFHVHCPRMT